LGDLYAQVLQQTKTLFEARAGQGRATTEISDAARAATFGAVETLLVGVDEVIPGTVDEAEAKLTLAKELPGVERLYRATAQGRAALEMAKDKLRELVGEPIEVK
jgi:hypothetical protein